MSLTIGTTVVPQIKSVILGGIWNAIEKVIYSEKGNNGALEVSLPEIWKRGFMIKYEIQFEYILGRNLEFES